MQCSADPIYEWFISPNNIVVICSVGVLSVIFLIIVSVIFTRRRRISSAHRQKMSRLRHHFDSNTKASGYSWGFTLTLVSLPDPTNLLSHWFNIEAF